ncbi:hypothetical protein B0A52_05024 [Exophiala mesophila]|uniref:AB hydrolase-1 domain-containing protein n=1 Tax=Exophiala mesophila TaxID=212818 RepID=A0A438N6T6_EXOME|nr:hypothetical protein B0A52_05024 [Exophiala mesophila]
MLRFNVPLLLLLSPMLARAAPVSPYSQLEWTHCEANATSTLLDCATLQVPMNWLDPTGEQITLDITRLRTNSPKRIGSLFVNPGGPGGAAAELCEGQARDPALYSQTLQDHYDIICPDPRGVGKSSRVECDPKLWAETPSYFVEDEASFQKILEFNKRLGADCLSRTGPLMGFVDTTNAAKDLEAIRTALGEEKLNWLGWSYGTQLGAAYAELFPEKVGNMVLDGAVDHSMRELEGFVMTNWAMEDEMRRFFDWCNSNTTCAIYGEWDSADLWDGMVAEANRNPIPAPGCLPDADTESAGRCQATVTGYDLIFNLENNFMSPNEWIWVSNAMNESLNGNATLLSRPDPVPGTGVDYPNLAIGCLDWQPNSTTYDEHIALQNLGSAMFPHNLGSGMSMQFATTCIGWPFKPTNPQHWLDPAKMALAPPILVVNSEHDPATPISWAHGLIRQIPKGVLLTRTGDGHTSYVDNLAAREIMDAFLVNGTLPAPNTIVE